MGMAASQARFLGLTARKTNVEYEGQQINQQRTTLSNQSANYYNDLLGMSVPVPPSVDDYTKTVYTFEDGALTNQITAMIAQSNGTYTVSYLRQWTDDFSVVGASTSIVNKSGTEDDYTYKVGATTLRNMSSGAGELEGITEEEYFMYNGYELTAGEKDGDYTPYSYQDDEGKTTTVYFKDDKWYSDKNGTELKDNTPVSKTRLTGKYTGDDDYLKTLSNTQLQQLLNEEKEYIEMLNAKYGEGEYMVRYVQNTTTGEYTPYFYKLSDLENASYDKNTNNSQSNIKSYTIGSETKSEEVKAVEGCMIEKDSSGRYINITIPDASGNKVTYSLTTSTVTDQDAYDDAMNQYEYEKYEYDQAISEINAKIETVQAQDKNLELRLKQLDTEQDAIQTEMDAVQKVIEKNTESTFKTFG